MAEQQAVSEAVPALSKTQAKRVKRGNVHAYKTAKGTKYLVQVRSNGNYAAKSFDNMKDAKAWRAAKEAEFASGEVAARVPSKMKMTTLFTTYLTESEKNGNPVSNPVRMMFARIAAHDAFSDTLVSKVDYTLVRDYCVARKASGVLPSTIQGEYVRIDTALKCVGDWLGWKNFNPLKGARTKLRKDRLISDSYKRHRRPSGEEMDALIDYFTTREAAQRAAGVKFIIPMADIIRFAALNAFRRGEITQLLWTDLADYSVVCHRKDCTADNGKREDITPVLVQAREIIDRQPRIEGEPRIFPYCADTVSGYFTDACYALGINKKDTPKNDRLRFHDLRHEAISTIAQHVGMVEAMQVSGHQTTKAFKVYCNFGDKDAGNIIGKLQKISLTSAMSISGHKTAKVYASGV